MPDLQGELHRKISLIDKSLKHYFNIVMLGGLLGTLLDVLIFMPIALLDFVITMLFGFDDLMIANLNRYWFFAYFGAFLVIGGYRLREEELNE